METVTAFEAKTRFGKLLERVARGEEIVITRHDKPVARIVPEGRGSVEEVRAAVEALRKLRASIAARHSPKEGLSDEEIRSLIDEGRR